MWRICHTISTSRCKLPVALDTKGDFFTGAYNRMRHIHQPVILNTAPARTCRWPVQARKAMNLCLEQVRPRARRPRLRWNWPGLPPLGNPLNKESISLTRPARPRRPYVQKKSPKVPLGRFKSASCCFRLFKDFGNNTGTDSVSAFTDSETQTFAHGDRHNQCDF